MRHSLSLQLVCAAPCFPLQRGLAPRVFDYLFQKVGEEEDAKVRCPLFFPALVKPVLNQQPLVSASVARLVWLQAS